MSPSNDMVDGGTDRRANCLSMVEQIDVVRHRFGASVRGARAPANFRYSACPRVSAGLRSEEFALPRLDVGLAFRRVAPIGRR
jgi:hypothetical protein